MVKLGVRDNKPNPNATASNTETLIYRDKVVAMLGSCTPALVDASALVAEHAKKPIVTGCDPLKVFPSVRKWKYAGNFFSVPEPRDRPMGGPRRTRHPDQQRSRSGTTMVPNGQAIGGISCRHSPRNSLRGHADAEIPGGQTQFTWIIGEAGGQGAEVVLIDTISPQAIAIHEQIASAGYTPKVLNIEKGAEPVQFAEALGKLADGILVGGYWDPSLPYPGAADLAKASKVRPS